jgi:hypothetical protein
MGPRWGQRVRRADPTRPIAGPVSSLTSANNFNAGASPPENRKVSLVRSADSTCSVPRVVRIFFTAIKLLGDTTDATIWISHDPTPWAERAGMISIE